MIPLYWWEGYGGPRTVLSRLGRGQHPYVQNFGDLLSPFIVSSMAGRSVRYSLKPGKLLALGSILSALSSGDRVWGSGFLSSDHIRFAVAQNHVRYHAVRGPQTRSLLTRHGLDCPEVYGDPALLLPRFVKDDVVRSHRLGFIPHFSHARHFRKQSIDPALRMIDVEQPVAEVVRAILSCEVVLSTSLHGLIVAEAYGRPALLLVQQQPLQGDLLKFRDYFEATNRDLVYEPYDANLSRLVERALAQGPPVIDLDPLESAFPCGITPVAGGLSPDRLELPGWSTFRMPTYPTGIGLSRWVQSVES